MLLLIISIIFFGAVESSADIFKNVSDDGVIVLTNVPLDRNSRLIIKETRSADNAKKENSKIPRKEVFHAIAEDKAKEHDIDPDLVKAVIKAESNWEPDAISSKGAIGLMQLMPSTALYMGVGNPLDPIENVDGGIRYLKYLIKKFNGDISLALAAYNAGPSRVERFRNIPPISETITYVRKVMNTYSGNKGRDLNADFRKIKTENNNIRKIILEDGTVLFTNYHPAYY